MITKEIEAGALPDTLPGFEVSAHSGGVVLKLDKLELPGFAAKSAANLADDIQALVETVGCPGRAANFTGAGRLVIGRKGNGFVLAYSVGGVEIGRKTATRGILVDLARHLRTAALEVLRTH